MKPTFLALLLLQAPPAAPAAEAAASAELPFTYHERLIFVRLAVNDAPERLFLLDTGASASALDAHTAAELGLPRGEPTEVEGSAGVVRVESARVAALRAGALAVEDLRVTVQDLGASLQPPGEHLDGIVGSDFLAGFALELDFEESRATLRRGPSEPDGAALPLELENGIPRFAARLDDLETVLRIDTGASLFATRDVYVNVPEPVWDELRRADPALAPERTLQGAGVGGSVTLPVARIRALLVGPHTFARPYVIVQPRQGYFARPDAVGFVGNNYLEKYGRVTLDYPGRRLWLGPRPSAR